MKKRILAVLVALVLLCLPLAVQAEELVAVPNNPIATTPAEPVTYAPGEAVTLTLALPAAYANVSSGSVEVLYDTDNLELTEIGWVISGTLLKHFDLATARGVFSFSNPKNVEGDLITLTFRVGEDAPAPPFSFR